MRSVVLAVVLFGACGGGDGDEVESDDAGGSVAAAYSHSISVGGSTVEASPLMPRTVTITGAPHQPVVVSLDRVTAGALSASTLTLDANGRGSLVFTPCAGVVGNCLGAATLLLSPGIQPSASLATAPFTLVYPAQVGEVAPCTTNRNIMHLHGNDFIEDGTYQSSAGAAWRADPAIDQIIFTVDEPTTFEHFSGSFSLLELPQAIAPGIYDQAERYAFAPDGHPGMGVSGRGRGCNKIAGRFQVHDYTADPVYGTVHSVTISFEQACDPDYLGGATTTMTVGCFHYEQAPLPPVIPPTPDPTKVSVQVNSYARDGKPDPSAHAIFMDANGAVVLDTQVNAFGQAEVALPDGGSVTTVQLFYGYYQLNTYRGVKNGDHVVVYPASGATGVKDQMLATYTAPPGATWTGLLTACQSGSTIAPGKVALDFFDGCRTPTFGILGIATMPAPERRQFLWQAGFSHVANTNVSLSGTWMPFADATIRLTNVPSGTPPIRAEWATNLDAVPYVLSTAYINVPVPSDQTLTVEHAPGGGNGTNVTINASWPYISTSVDTRTVVDTGYPSSVTFDYATQLVPMASALNQTTTGVSWAQTAGGADARMILWRGATPTSYVLWNVLEPNDGQTSSTLPTLPAAYAALDPSANPMTRLGGVLVGYVDYDTVTGFCLSPPAGSYRSHTARAWTYNLNFSF